VAPDGTLPGTAVNVLGNFTVPEIVGVGADGTSGNVTAAVAELVRDAEV
jgi:hypothetical protein